MLDPTNLSDTSPPGPPRVKDAPRIRAREATSTEVAERPAPPECCELQEPSCGLRKRNHLAARERGTVALGVTPQGLVLRAATHPASMRAAPGPQSWPRASHYFEQGKTSA